MSKIHKQNNPIKLSRVIRFLIIPFSMLILLFVFYLHSTKDRNLPKLEVTDKDLAIRGNIISKDGYRIANSRKLYKATIDTRNLDPNKKDLFIRLYCIYTNDSEKRVKELIERSKSIVVLSYSIDEKTAAHLKQLAKKLNQKRVFIPVGTHNYTVGLNVLESGENREFLARNSLTPLIGYNRKIDIDGITKIIGVKGIEKYYNDFLSAGKNLVILGKRDIGGNIILSKDSTISKRQDGYDVLLNISLSLQSQIENMLDLSREKYNADEILLGIMESKTGKILTLASSRRYMPNAITKNDYNALNSTATEYAYEPGSVIKPIVLSIALEEGKTNPTEMINTHNGKYQLASRTITDTHPAAKMSTTDVIVYSSNIGMIEISKRLNAQSIYEGIVNFGLSLRSGIDLPYEQRGVIPTISMLGNETYKATISYGYGLQATFIQLLNAYNVFNNGGISITPRIVSNLQLNGELKSINEPEIRQIIAPATAQKIKNILVQAVERGTGRKAYTIGLEIGGKTGTARVAKNGGYSQAYNSSFMGFVNDGSASYTMGVFVKEPKRGSYYAAQNALPIFKNAVEIMIKNGFLKPIETKPTKENTDKTELDNIKD